MGLKVVGPGKAKGRVLGEEETFLGDSEDRKDRCWGCRGNNVGDLQPEGEKERGPQRSPHTSPWA